MFLIEIFQDYLRFFAIILEILFNLVLMHSHEGAPALCIVQRNSWAIDLRYRVIGKTDGTSTRTKERA